MEKACADKMLEGYMKKLFGFALQKTRGIDEAEELAARLTLEVYAALRQAESIANPDGYVWRIACHTFARYVNEQRRENHRSLDGLTLVKPHYPAHMQALCRAMCMENPLSDGYMRICVIDRLLAEGVLTLPTEQQKNGLATILFCDTLPA